MAASATFALKVGVWFRRGRLFMVSPDSLGTACPLSGRNSTYRPVQISETSSHLLTKSVLRTFCRPMRWHVRASFALLVTQEHLKSFNGFDRGGQRGSLVVGNSSPSG